MFNGCFLWEIQIWLFDHTVFIAEFSQHFTVACF